MAEFWPCTLREYHADTSRQGSSMLNTLLDSPPRYKAMFVDTPPTIAWEESDDLLLGNVVHCQVLEPEKFSMIYAVAPECDMRTNKGKEEWANFKGKYPIHTAIKTKLYDQASRMSDSVRANPQAWELIQSGRRELAVKCELDDVPCKVRADVFIENYSSAEDLLLDLKTASNPTPEKWRSPYSPMIEYGYNLQVAAMYPLGFEQVTGRTCLSGVIVVGKSAPHDVYTYSTAEYRDQGTAWLRKALRMLHQCQSTGVWQRPEQQRVERLPAPAPWSYPSDE